MNSLWPSRASGEGDAAANPPTTDVTDTGVPDAGLSKGDQQQQALPVRPLLQRNAQPQTPPAFPPPPSDPPPPPSASTPLQPPTDSLSLAQLRRLVADFPHAEAAAYDFEYQDTAPIEEEIDEWFVYQFWQWVRLNGVQRAFEWQWLNSNGQDTSWEEVGDDARKAFVSDALAGLSSETSKERSANVARLVYITLGRWTSTAGGDQPAIGTEKKPRCAATPAQLEAMKASVRLIADVGGTQTIFDALKKAFEPFWPEEAQHTQSSIALNPSLVDFFAEVTGKLRWDEAQIVPQAQVFLLLWKSILLVFGGSEELAETKRATRENPSDDKDDRDVITASPLDYHVFRQEITSKYPAYIPPQPAIPLEAENTSLLPPLPSQQARNNGAQGILPPQPGTQPGGASILHQPVHIATPAPSPPPSPGVGGKGVKKQNYQTNQNFPFMYPPLDESSNSLGGKGNTALQDMLVTRKWEGGDVPASILEAGELFSNRVRMTRAARQLWQERERFIKFERGWDESTNDILDELDLSSLTLEEKEELGLVKPKKPEPEEIEVDYGPSKDLDARTKQRLDAVERFYANSLPILQSISMTLIKSIIAHWTVVMTQQPQGSFGVQGQNNGRVNGNVRGQDGPNGTNGAGSGDDGEPSPEELDAARTREITQKAVSAIMLLLLKWFKLSLLKLFLHQDVQQVIESKADRIENSFFYFCNVRAGAPEKPAQQKAEAPAAQEEESEDDAAPPPIKRRRSPTEEAASGDASGAAQQNENGASVRPEVDELGYPVNPLPAEPITDFSRRNFFTLINYLRVMQKICKHKAHRNLLLVHYKSSNVLRKNLRIPQDRLRLYTLKLFKNQVPYCSRKWRQSNMRVITAIYLYCRPELRDEWLAGADIDAEMDEALPLEQALRSLTHWFNVRRYPDRMAPEVRDALREEHDFFSRELERLEVSWDDMGAAESVNGEWEEIPGWG
ncbi:putative required for hyphal anastomosis [Diaporthe ampelina]|uniref:Putative required for hyphal anastomosis n=1 Tax=Diaporthe ampelina TaxID=1214573 RepID=A0A0G2HKJ4_9PEZI|nr:putative required for hyphal anastomosis [Diaporthe ampelina]